MIAPRPAVLVADRQPPAAAAPVRTLALALTALGVFLVSLDVSIANAVLPAIGNDFSGASRPALAWVITAYAIVFAATLVPGGRVADRAGRRRVFSAGLALFGVGSLVCGIAFALPMLLLGRVLQGAGAATLQPASLGLLLATVPVAERAQYTARWFGAGALGIGLGPLVGGLAADVLDWRVAFLINIPFVLWALRAAPRALAETERHPGRSLPDPAGALLLAGAAAALTFGISQRNAWALGAGLVLAAWFVHRCRTVADPLLRIEMLRSRRLAKVTVATLAYSGAFFGLLFSFVLFLTSVWGLSTVEAGLCVSLMAAVVIPLSRGVGHLPARIGFAAPLTVGVALIAVALLLAVAVATGGAFKVSWLLVMLVAGVGIGLCYPLLGAAALVGLPPADLAAATALNQCARQLGAALGVALTVAALGSTASPDAGRFHTAWLLCAALCGISALAALTVDRGAS